MRAIDLADLEDAWRVVRLECVGVDAEVRDLLQGALTRELAQEANPRNDRNVRRIATGDSRLESRRIVRANGLVLRGDAGLCLESVEDLLEVVLLTGAPERHDVDRAAGYR